MSGVFIHHKGGRYRKLFDAAESTNSRVGAHVIVYVSLTTGRVRVRDAIEWNERVMWPDGVERTRFIPEDEP